MPKIPSYKTSTYALAAIVLAGAASATPAIAANFVGLVDGKTLVMFDSDARKVVKTLPLSGVPSLVGIDVRPADGLLYGVTPDGTVVVIDTATGKASEKSKLKSFLPPGVAATVDFNPVADRLRIIGKDGTNLRANVDDGAVTTDGALKFADADGNKGGKAGVVAGAYTNSFKGAKETALFNIDGALGAMVKQAPPNDGILNTVGKLDAKLGNAVAFDIESDGAGGNIAWVVTGGALHKLDLASGKVSTVGKLDGVSGEITDIAVLPAK